MRPILFVWHGIVVRSYPVMVYLALLATVFLTVHLAQASGLDADRAALTVVLAYIPAFAGARFMYVARHWDRFRPDPVRILRRSEGGLSLSGGIFGLFAGATLLLWALGLPAAPFFDALVLGMLGGIAIAKGGCLLNGCCYGHPTGHWCGVDLPDDGGAWRRRFPVQILEMGWALAVLVTMLAWRSVLPPSGALACAGLALHAGGRIVLQNLRDEGAEEDAAVRKTCCVLIVVALAAWLVASL